MALGGCATVTVDSGERRITARGLFGTRVEQLSLYPIAIRSSGFGVFATPNSLTVGRLRQVALFAPNGDTHCQVVLLGNTPAQAAELVGILERGGIPPSRICVEPGEGK
ncbi:hypothetical protein [Lysobacter fragariae]